MTDINKLVLHAINEELGCHGAEMYNDGPKGQGTVQAGLFSEPGNNIGSKEGAKAINQTSSDTSSFAKESVLPAMKEAANSNNLAGTNENVVKNGGSYEFSKKADIASRLSGYVVKSSLTS